MYLSYRRIVRIINSGLTIFPTFFFLFFKEDETWFYNFILCVPICNFQAKEI